MVIDHIPSWKVQLGLFVARHVPSWLHAIIPRRKTLKMGVRAVRTKQMRDKNGAVAYAMLQLWLANDASDDAEQVRATLHWKRKGGGVLSQHDPPGLWLKKVGTEMAGYRDVDERMDLPSNGEEQHLGLVAKAPGSQEFSDPLHQAATDEPVRGLDTGRLAMKAIVVTDQAAGTAGMTLVERPEPQAAINDVVVQVHASGFVPTELGWPSTWADRFDRDRTPSIPGHELAGVVTALGYGTRGLSMGQRVFGLTDWYRDGTLAEYAAVEARNLAPLPGDVDFTVGASLPISALTAWQGLFEHGRLQAGQTVLVHGAAGAVGSMATQLAREAGAYVVGTGRAADRQMVLDFGAKEFVDLDNDALEDVGEVDLVFDVIGGDIGKRSAGLIRAGGTLVSIVGPPEARPADGLAVDFVVESDRARLSEIVQRVRDGRLRTNIGNVSTLDDAVAAFNRTERHKGKTIIRVRP